MGALHDGHLSLVEAAGQRCAAVAATIFVNPLQFNQAADLDAYPQPLERDLELLEESGCDLVFTPSVLEMYPSYPDPPLSTVHVEGAALGLEGEGRPGHFDGVATIVATLLSLTGPSVAFFGEKDFQQLAVVRQLVADLGLPAEIVGCPIIREPDGLAMSSRNVRLVGDARTAALVLRRSLDAGLAALDGAGTPADAEAAMADVIASEPLATLSYGVCVDPATLAPPAGALDQLRLLIAAEVGGVRLLDNCAWTRGC